MIAKFMASNGRAVVLAGVLLAACDAASSQPSFEPEVDGGVDAVAPVDTAAPPVDRPPVDAVAPVDARPVVDVASDLGDASNRYDVTPASDAPTCDAGGTCAPQVLERPLIRLQCYDGMEQREALYEWNHAAQLLHMRAAEHKATPTDMEREVYQERYLVKRPLLQALQTPAPGAVLLIDEVDRADEPFEAFLLEYLGEYQVSIPELGTLSAMAAPMTILTSNRTRDLNDAVKRRCLYQWMDYPDRERELAIVRSQVPQASARLSEEVTEFVARLRSQPFVNAFQRAPGVAESVEWAKALVALDTLTLDPEVVQDTVGLLFKQREDVAALLPLLDDLLKPAA